MTLQLLYVDQISTVSKKGRLSACTFMSALAPSRPVHTCKQDATAVSRRAWDAQQALHWCFGEPGGVGGCGSDERGLAWRERSGLSFRGAVVFVHVAGLRARWAAWVGRVVGEHALGWLLLVPFAQARQSWFGEPRPGAPHGDVSQGGGAHSRLPVLTS